jgi:hypothetical protein
MNTEFIDDILDDESEFDPGNDNFDDYDRSIKSVSSDDMALHLERNGYDFEIRR